MQASRPIAPVMVEILCKLMYKSSFGRLSARHLSKAIRKMRRERESIFFLSLYGDSIVADYGEGKKKSVFTSVRKTFLNGFLRFL